jgi:hypothetical protein
MAGLSSEIIAVVLDGKQLMYHDQLEAAQNIRVRYLKEIDRRFSSPFIQLPLLADNLIGKDKPAQAGLLFYGA